MPKHKHVDVGRSDGGRTDNKHRLMWGLAGEEVATVQKIHPIRRSVMYDLTAGDAASTGNQPWHEASSPGILAYHAKWEHMKKPVLIGLHERNSRTYQRLLDNLGEHLPSLGYRRTADSTWALDGGRVEIYAVCKDSREASISAVRSGDAVFVLNDPNSMADWAMRDGFYDEVRARTPWFRSMSAMGFNASGMKMGLDLPRRETWQDHIEGIRRGEPGYRDLALVKTDSDPSQWAYLVATAAKWKDRTDERIRRTYARSGMTCTIAWWSHGPVEFENLLQPLVYWKSELNGKTGKGA